MNKVKSVFKSIGSILLGLVGIAVMIFLLWVFFKIYFQIWALFGVKSKAMVLILSGIIRLIFTLIMSS